MTLLAIVLITGTAVVLGIVLLSFFAPSEPKHPFWRGVFQLRAYVDAAAYWFINALAIGAVLLALGTIVYAVLCNRKKPLHRGLLQGD